MTTSPQSRSDVKNCRTSSAAAPMLRVEELAKNFGSTRALASCSLTVLPGEVHAVMGENGSGKSTLVKILSGVHRPDRGYIEFAGSQVPPFRSPRDPLAVGLGTVFQEVLVVGARSVLDNVWLGVDGLLTRRVSEEVKRSEARDVLTALLGDCPPLDTPVERLALSERQACGIARALVRDPRLIVLDEATSSLDIATRDRLFNVVRNRVARGCSAIFISHRMDEVEELADRVTVLRSGRSVATVGRGQATSRSLARLMSGEEAGAENDATRRPRTKRELGRTMLRTEALRLRDASPQIVFSLRKGEIVGLAGLEGHGQEEFLRALWGQFAAGGQVVWESDAGSVVLRGGAQAAKLGIAYVPRDRRTSMFASLSIRENFAAPTAGMDAQWGLLRRARADSRLSTYAQAMAIKYEKTGARITTLSGGNQQKIAMARWLAVEPKVLLLNDPTRGVDIAAKRDIYSLVRRLASEGVGVVMLSTELDEHVALTDRVLVFREGAVFAELDNASLRREDIVEAYFGRRS